MSFRPSASSADSVIAIGVAIAYVSWGGAMAAFLSSNESLLTRSTNTSPIMRTFLLCYVRGMFLLSTTAVLCNMLSFVQDIDWGSGENVYVGFSGVPNGAGIAGAACLLVAILFSDGFLFWRCYMLYATTTPVRRKALAVALCLLMVALISLSLMYIVQLSRSEQPSSSNFVPERTRAAIYFVSMTLGINVVLTTLIVLRLVWHHHRIAKLFGRHHSKVYTRIISVCIESASIIVPIDVLCILFFFTPKGLGSAIPYESLIHFYVIAPLYIIHKVASGQAAGTNSSGLGDDPEHSPAVDEVIARGRHHLTTLAFTHSVSVVVRESTETEHPETITLVPLMVH